MRGARMGCLLAEQRRGDRLCCSGPMKYQTFGLSLSKGFDQLSPNGIQDFTGPDL